ncbi:MAG: ABC transporter permease [Dehalococcoidia bacterium]|nr:MAG: ABC transporter permease [Dehalococcoidia bacterium]
MQGLAGYIIRRLLWAPAILLAVSLVTFALGRFGPGDPVQQLQGQYRDPEVRERVADELGYNDSFFVQYWHWLKGAVQGDFGETLEPRGFQVKDVIFPKLWVTFQYNVLALVIIFGVGIPAGIWAALRQGSWMDPFTIGVLLLFTSVPVLVSIPVLQWLFALKLGWLPSGGWEVREFFGVEIGVVNKRIILPLIVLTLAGFAGVARYTRAQVLEVLDQDFVRTARAKGLQEFTVVSRHIARNALLPLATMMGFALVGLLGGSIFLETLLGIPGIGRYAWEAVSAKDSNAIMAIVLLTSTAFIAANLLVDITYGFIDPRIRLGARAER